MKKDLSGIWKVKQIGKEGYIDINVPMSITHNLLQNGMIEDPFYRENEEIANEIASNDYEYMCDFAVDDSLLDHDIVMLVCKGLDTISEISLNGKLVAKTNNMHRTYEFDVKQYLIKGSNAINIVFKSPTGYIDEKQKICPLWKKYGHIRKAHYMFGWDWGPIIPDMGIWRDIYLQGYNTGKLEDVYITQEHSENSVNLDIRINTDIWQDKLLNAEVTVISPSNIIYNMSKELKDNEEHLFINIENPLLWWPNGYGKQMLYTVTILLKDEQKILDSKELNIGLRTINIKQVKDEWGESFQFEINSVSIFAMGSNYIPEDSLLTRCNRERTERLIQDCIEANYNCIRVWGGGIYCEDYFY